VIGVDTNVLLRAFVNDDPAQGEVARAFIGRRTPDDPTFVCLIVLVEFAWSLRRTFGYSSAQAHEAVKRLLEASDSRVEHSDIVARCLALPLKRGLDIADLLIAEVNRLHGCNSTVTFDQDAARLAPGMELLA